MSRWSLGGILTSLFAVAGAVTLVIVVLVVTALMRLDHARTDRVATYGPASLTAETLAKAYSDQETGIRGFISTGREGFLDPYRNGRDSEQRALRTLRRELVDRRDLLSLIDDVGDAAARWRDEVATPAITTTRREGPRSVSIDQVEAGRTQFDAIRAAVARLQRPILVSRNEAGDVLNQQLVLLRVVLGMSLLLLLVVAAVTALALRRFITDPLRRLGREVGQVEGGDLSHSVSMDAVPLEIRTLAEQIDRMRLRIVQEYALAENARKQAIDARLLVEEQAVDLQRSNTELEQFAYVASHDLQEPLRKVASFCQLLERRYKGQLDERADQYIDFAVDGAKRMQQLINDLLAFSRVGRLTSGFTEVDLDEALGQALRQLDASIEDTGATVTHDPLPTVNGDTTLLVQLFQNLVGNAVKFRGDDAPVIHLSARREGEHWELSCADNGIGVDKQYADKIFVIFQRLHGRDVYGGTGIGLAMCKKIVEYHGGRMWLDHDAAQGATFRWTLPARSEDLDPPADPAPPAEESATPDGAPDVTQPASNDERILDDRVPAHPADRGAVGGGRPG